MIKNLKIIIGFSLFLFTWSVFSQQDPQFTQYMYNTMSVNSAYVGSRGHLSITGIHRAQWVGIEGSPRTQTLTIDTPVGKNVGLGLSVVNDDIGPSNELYADLNFSYTIKASETHRLSFGIKGGARRFNLDFTKGQSQNPDAIFQNINNRYFPTVGAGVYLRGDKSYVGVSIPNFFTDQHYDDTQQSVASEQLHFFFIGGLLFDINKNTRLKPAFLVKHVVGSPLIFDLSVNAILYDRFRMGLSYRWDDSVSALAGFQITPGILVGYSYDYTTTELQRFTSGSHEFMIRFELKSEEKRLKSPRFF